METKSKRLYSTNYRPDIDGLRAFAVLAVVGFHAFPEWVRGGFVGVDIFFVISGYLITSIIFKNLEVGGFSFSEFYARRIKRIFPALLVVLIACLFFGWIALLADEYKQLSGHVVAGVGFFSNIAYWNEAGYFDNAADTKPLLHLWSLGIEEQFYIVWPLLLWIAWKQKFNLLIITFFIFLISFLLNINIVTENTVKAFYSPMTRIWELLTGSILSYFIIYRRISPERFGRAKSNMFSVVGFLVLIFSIIFIKKDYFFPGWVAIFPVIGSFLIICAGNTSIVNSKILSNKIAIWFGQISFPLYLWHWPILSLSRLIEGQTAERTTRFGLVLLSILLAWLTYKFIEKYVRLSKGNSYTIVLIIIGLFTASFSSYVYLKNGIPMREAVTKSEFTEKIRNQFMGPLWEYTKNDICLKQYPFKNSDKLPWWFCMKSDSLKPTIVILGNSFANQLYPGFVENQALKHHTILSIGICEFEGDEPNDVNVSNPCFGQRGVEQKEFIDNIIQNNNTIKFVVIGGLSRNPNKNYIERLHTRISTYESKGIKVILFTPHITPHINPKSCFTTPLRRTAKDCSFPFSERESLFEGFSPVIETLKITNPNVSVFEQNEIFCNGQTDKCGYVRKGMPLHRDAGHISEFASKEIQSYFNEWAKINTPEIFDLNKIRK